MKQSKAKITAELWEILDTFKDISIQDHDSVVHAKEDGNDKGTKVVVENKKETQNNHAVCKSCSSDDVVLDDGNYVCRKCGDLIDRFIDTTAEWRYYGHDDNKASNPTRCGLPTNDLLPESSLGSVIGYSNHETHDIKIMRKYHMWNSMSYRERSLYNIFNMLTVNSVNNGLTKSIIDDAMMLYKQISDLKISRGENKSGLVASAIYMACKRNKVPRSAKEIAKIFNLKPTTMTRGCKKFMDMMKMKMESSKPDDFISRFCSKLNMTAEMKDVCKVIVKRANDLGLVSENTPPAVAAGTIYMCNMILNWGFSKKEVSDACEISQVTISKCYKKMSPFESVLLPQTQKA